MKTAISLPDVLFTAAEEFAREQGLSRSELYARALQNYLDTHRDQAVIAALNAVYTQEASNIEPALMEVQTQIFKKEEW